MLKTKQQTFQIFHIFDSLFRANKKSTDIQQLPNVKIKLEEEYGK